MRFENLELIAFAAVVQAGTVGRAATVLHSTQPTISRHIKSLERRLGHSLFDRDSSGMHLTPAGREFAPHAQALLLEMELAREAMDELRGIRRGTLRIGGVPGVIRGEMPQVLSNVARRAPNIRLEVMEGSEDQLSLALAHRKVDVIFLTEPPADIETVVLGSRQFEDRFCVFSSAEHPLRQEMRIEMPRLLQELWAMPRPGATPRTLFQRLLKEHRLPMPQIALQTDSVDVMVEIVARTSVLGWLPSHLIATHLDAGDIVTLSVPYLEYKRTFRPYRRARGSFPHAAQLLIDAMEDCGRPDEGQSKLRDR